MNSSQTEYLNDKVTHQPDDTIKEESEVQLKIIKPQVNGSKLVLLHKMYMYVCKSISSGLVWQVSPKVSSPLTYIVIINLVATMYMYM